ncbi:MULTISPECIES: hypothetical protein [Bacillus]|uniref:hypothetical protein n=1 Tax=Bacillus TaxID=1386 RepID=UPI000BB81E84|nr:MULTISPECIES: hypothetical protein [Bacillus]
MDRNSFRVLSKKAVELEKQLNEEIKKHLNKQGLATMATENGEMYAMLLKQLQDYMEILSIHFNQPTKNDIANLAKLVIQTEEKIDNLEEEILDLKKSINDLTNRAIKLPTMQMVTDKRSKSDEHSPLFFPVGDGLFSKKRGSKHE